MPPISIHPQENTHGQTQHPLPRRRRHRYVYRRLAGAGGSQRGLSGTTGSGGNAARAGLDARTGAGPAPQAGRFPAQSACRSICRLAARSALLRPLRCDAVRPEILRYRSRPALSHGCRSPAELPPALCLQNGVENEARIAAALGAERVIYGTVTSAVGRKGPGHIVLERLRGVGVAAGHPLSAFGGCARRRLSERAALPQRRRYEMVQTAHQPAGEPHTPPFSI